MIVVLCCRPPPPPPVPSHEEHEPGRRLGICELPMPPMMDVEPEPSYTPDSESRRPAHTDASSQHAPSPDPNIEVPARIQK